MVFLNTFGKREDETLKVLVFIFVKSQKYKVERSLKWIVLLGILLHYEKLIAIALWMWRAWKLY